MKSLRHAHLQLSFNSREPIYQQIKTYIVSEIQRGRLLPGVLLPGTRILAKQLKVNRNTIIMVYEQLTAQGWLTSQYKSGTRISDTMPAGRQPDKPVHIDIPFNNFTFPVTQPYSKGDYEIAFDDGQPDLKLTPLLTEITKECKRLLQRRTNKQLLQYNSERGNEKLLLEINGILNNDRGLAMTPPNICITYGHQLSIYLTARTLIKPGDHIAVEHPGYQPAWHTFTMAGAQLHQVATDGEGINIEQLESLCKKQQLKAVYVTPHHQYPTTVPLSATRRKQLLALSETYHFMIIEDDYDHEYYFTKDHILPVAGIQQSGNVIYIGTLSNKIPLSFVCGPVAFIQSLAASHMMIYQQENPVLELAVTNLMKSGELRKHQHYTRTVYQKKMEVAAGIISTEFTGVASFTKPLGGLAVWLELYTTCTPDQLSQKLQSAGMNVVSPYRYYDPLYNGPLGLRLGYASMEEPLLIRGLEKMSKVLQQLG
ncbi:GntR family transcriptional regulator / MocR family aminotransferase [Chitinophaga sp. CF118]|uniref:aminotransferase-like domain-containing protein n=1 Tax=Chitinophaga sp. CF118 TaxID=1884367 RepID=UPI0008E27581|nr:PLP-dependent aminotransferase family protein [Chitinophaga sp. CF118]SFF03128.1 GntR family transcriptional regulator / MocR family aminotransferase [Chitinophaga sp. CF118]